MNLPGNLVVLCGSGTTGCHGWVERNRRLAGQVGLLLPTEAHPSQELIYHATHGMCWLTNAGGVHNYETAGA